MSNYRRSNYRNDPRIQQGRRQAAPLPPPPAAAPKRMPVKIDGDAQLWVTLQKVTDPTSGWIKTTRAMQTPVGVLINTCSRKSGTDLVAEALALVPGVKLDGRKLAAL